MAETNDEVHVGKDDYLFLSGGNHGVFSYFSGDRDPKPGSTENFRTNVENRSRFCEKKGLPFRTVVFPEKCVALRSLLSLETPLTSLYERCYLQEIEASSVLSTVLYPLDKIQGNTPAFFRTDTHYAAPGNLAVTRSIVSDLLPVHAETGIAMISARLGVKQDISGDLGRKFTPPRTEDATVMKGPPVPITLSSNGVKGGNDGICVLADSPESLSDKTLVIFGDSFFRAILPMLAVFYRRIIFCRTRFFHYEMIGAFAPDHVLCGVAERYMSNCTLDETRPHFLSYPLVLGRSIDPDPDFSALWEKFVDQGALIE
jgi:hypothetical protein